MQKWSFTSFHFTDNTNKYYVREFLFKKIKMSTGRRMKYSLHWPISSRHSFWLANQNAAMSTAGWRVVQTLPRPSAFSSEKSAESKQWPRVKKKVSGSWFSFYFWYVTMSNCIQNCWVNWNYAVLCFERLFDWLINFIWHFFAGIAHESLLTYFQWGPFGEDKEENYSFRSGRKTPENSSGENPRDQVGTENPIHIVPSVGFEPGTPSVEGEESTATPTWP